MKTTRLYGDGRHRKLSFVNPHDGRAYSIDFRGVDCEVYIPEFGTDIPVAVAEYLFFVKGSGIRFPGGAPRDAVEREAKLRAKFHQKQEGKHKRGDHRGVGTGAARDWPTSSWPRERLLSEGVRAGLRKSDLTGLDHDSLLEAVEEKLTHLYPAWAEQQGHKSRYKVAM